MSPDWRQLHQKPERIGIGLMSGTSCDGIDAALVRVAGTGPSLVAQLLAFQTMPYNTHFRDTLLNVQTVQEICLLHTELGIQFAEAARDMQQKASVLGVDVDYVASHGHTVYHCAPGPNSPVSGTLQLGNPSFIAEYTGLPVISDFRSRDMAAHGQGAPLVPYVDWLLFRETGPECTLLLNVGGIANITMVTESIDDVIAFDTGPGNMLIDGVVSYITQGREAMDMNGKIAQAGNVSDALMKCMLQHAYFECPPPKSTGREVFDFRRFLLPILESQVKKIQPADLVATVTAFTAQTIADAIRRFVLPYHTTRCMWVSGGGALNPTLMRMLMSCLPEIPVHILDKYGLDPEAKEAFAFAVLGNETLCNTPSNVPSATGAHHSVVLGSVTP